LKLRGNEKNNLLWPSLNEGQKQQVLLAYEESENEKNSIGAKAVFKNLK